MITEDYCSFEISKFLKKKGFEQHTTKLAYNKKGKLNWSDNLDPFEFSAPTHQMAMKWLREEHGFHISVAPYLNNKGEVTWVWEIINIETATIIADSLDDDDFDSCETAIDAAIKYCLSELI